MSSTLKSHIGYVSMLGLALSNLGTNFGSLNTDIPQMNDLWLQKFPYTLCSHFYTVYLNSKFSASCTIKYGLHCT